MQKIMFWAKNNTTLAFFFSLQLFALVAMVGWLGSVTYESYFPNTHSVEMNASFENSLKKDIKMEVEKYKFEMTNPQNTQAQNLETAIHKFIDNKTSLVLMARPLNEEEIAKIDKSRLPILQQVVDVSNDATPITAYVVHDNSFKLPEQTIASLFIKK